MSISRKLIFLGTLCVVLLFGTLQAFPHDWYSLACCGNTHCHPIDSCSEILETAKGVVWNGIEFTKDKIHPSQDNHCHVCIMHGYNDYTSPMCIYVQQGS